MTVIENLPFDTPGFESGQHELSDLLELRASAFNDVLVQRASGDLDNNDSYHRAREALQAIDRRISEVNSELADAAVSAAIEDGVARPGSLITVMFDHDESDIETFALVSSGAVADHGSAQACSATSPLGEALMGCRVDDVRTYALPSGAECTVTVVEIAAQ